MNSKHSFKPIFYKESSKNLFDQSLNSTEHSVILAKKYFALWKLFIKHKNKNKHILEKEKLFDKKLSNFILNLKLNSTIEQHLILNNDLKESYRSNAFKKKKLMCTEIFEHRFQAQKEVIENQKVFITQQNDIINKLKSSTPVAVNNTAPLYFNYFNQSKSSVENDIKSSSKLVEHPLVKRMKEREEERKNRWLLFAERRKEKEKILAEKLYEEEEKIKNEKIRKQKQRILEKKEKERIRNKLELEKKRELEISNVLYDRGMYWYKILLCAKIFQGWKRYMTHLVHLQIFFTYKYERYILKRTLLSWNGYLIKKKDLLKNAAFWLEERYSLIRSWYHWKLEICLLKKQRKLLSVCYDQEIQRKMFKNWQRFSQKNITKDKCIMQSAAFLYDRILLMKSFHMWQKLPQILYFEREKEKRLREWESKVKSILPDYNVELL